MTNEEKICNDCDNSHHTVVQDLQREVDSFELPDLEAEYTDEEGDRLDDDNSDNLFDKDLRNIPNHL